MRLIDADALIEKIRKLPNAGIRWFVSAEAVFDTILKAPTIESWKKGVWTNNYCSKCGYSVEPWNNTPYCPHCGEKMESGDGMTIDEAINELTQCYSFNSKTAEKKNKAISIAIEALGKQRWIPVTERLPEENDYKSCIECLDGAVWYFTKNGTMGIGYYYKSTKEWSTTNDLKTDGKVVAWMPLPESY